MYDITNYNYSTKSQRPSSYNTKTAISYEIAISIILFLAAGGSLLATTLVCEVPFLANAFGFTHVGLTEYLIAIGLGAVVIPVVELVKFIQRKVYKD